MKLFGIGKGKEKKEETPAAAPVTARTAPFSLSPESGAGVLRRPRVTEKATALSERSVYVFEIDPRAAKGDVRRALRALSKVEPVKIRIVRLPGKRTGSFGRPRGRTPGLKKAYVYYPAGTTLDLA